MFRNVAINLTFFERMVKSVAFNPHLCVLDFAHVKKSESTQLKLKTTTIKMNA